MGKVANRVAPETGAVQRVNRRPNEKESRRRPGRGRQRVKGRGRGKGPRWVKGLLIRRISEEGPISKYQG